MCHRVSLALALLFVFSCSSSDPALVPVIGAPQELAPLTGEWTGSYDSPLTGRSGSITFHLTGNPQGAHGDVVFIVPPDASRFPDVQHRDPFGGAAVLNIEFVRIANGEISGRIAPYPDPREPDGTLETEFVGRVSGDTIKGTFVTHSNRGAAPQRGTWSVRRHRMP